ncbi:hypothetical protein [Rhizobium sp. BK176]|uniref:hypothetical protein n=1 Tax=Rhizobium sp. BK176 TaxID=2587071 RepID=UPI002168978A|nr:hypothetical protein [Rhizobium sp. BK176]MCS4089274.1 hypothetical protein [Rhizobium sp. BK176]
MIEVAAVLGKRQIDQIKTNKYEAISMTAGFVAGCAFVGVDELQKAAALDWARVVAVIGLCSIVAVIHSVGAVPEDRLSIAKRWVRASAMTIVGAGVTSLVALVF